MIIFNFSRLQKTKCLTMSRLSAAFGPLRSAIVIDKTVISGHNFSQLSLAKTKASVLYKKRVLRD